MIEKLKPCPFCGTEEGLYPSHYWPGGGKPYAIDCIGCGMDFTPREGMDVVAAWNRRDLDAAKDDEIAKLREENERLREAMNQIAEMANWQIGVPTDTEAANEHARIAHTMAETARASALAKEPTP